MVSRSLGKSICHFMTTFIHFFFLSEMDNFTEPGDDVVVGRGPVGEEEVLMTEAAALEAFRVVDLLIQPDDRRQVVELEVGRKDM